MKSIVRILAMLALLAAFVGCDQLAEQVTVTLNKGLISNLPVGSEQTLTATVTPEEFSASVVWSSDNEEVAVVSKEGVVTGVAPGEAVITAKVGESSATCKVVVTAVRPTSIELNMAELDLEVDAVFQLEYELKPAFATADDVQWSSTDPEVVTVENGLLTALSVGEAVITVKCNDNTLAATCQVRVLGEVEEVSVTAIEIASGVALYVGGEMPLVWTVVPANATNKNVEFSVEGDCITVDEEGKVTALKTGEAVVTVSATDGSGVKAECNVTVTEDMSVKAVIVKTPNGTDLQVGQTLQLEVSFMPEDAQPVSVSWTMSDEDYEYAQVDQSGLMTGLSTENFLSDPNNDMSPMEWKSVVVTVTADGVSGFARVRVIPKQPESILIDLPENGHIRIGDTWNFNPRVLPEGLGYGVTCSIMEPGNRFTSDYVVSPQLPGTLAAQFAVASHENLVYGLTRHANVSVLPYWVESVSLPEHQNMEVGGSIILSPEFTSDVEGVQPTDKELKWTSSDETKAVVDNNGKVTALAAGTVDITATTSGSWSVPSDQSPKSVTCTVTITEPLIAAKVGDFYYSDGTVSSSLQTEKTVIGIVLSRDNATSTDKKLPEECTHGLVLALGEGYGNWSSSYDAGKVNTWAMDNGYQNTTGVYSYNWSYVTNDFGKRLLGHNNTSALRGYIAANGYTSGIIEALNDYNDALAENNITWPETASELYIPSIAEMDAIHENLEVLNASLKAAGGDEFVMDTADSQNDSYWTTSENEVSSGHAATINPFTGKLHGGVLKSNAKKVRFIFAF